MKTFKIIFFVLLMVVASMFVSCKHNGDNVVLKDQRDSISWAVGENTAIGMQNIGYNFNTEMVLKAIEHTLKNKKQPITEESYNELLAELTQIMQKNLMEQQQKTAEAVEQEEAKLFEALMAKDPEVKKAPEGFYYKVLRQGKGPNVKIGEVAVFDYKGYQLKDDQFIDQTYGVRPSIETLVGGGMFKGLQMGMAMMNAGSIYRLYFPSKLAFGAQGTDVIPPYTAIYYDVELHSFHP